MELKLLDGKVISVNDNETGFDVAKKISESLAKASIAYKLNGKLYDLSSLIKVPYLTILLKIGYLSLTFLQNNSIILFLLSNSIFFDKK